MQNFIREFFSFSKREYRSLFIYAIILFLIIVIRTAYPFLKKAPASPDQQLKDESRKFAESFIEITELKKKVIHEPDKNFNLTTEINFFDPNTISIEDMRKYGISEKIAKNIFAYRKAGGHFQEMNDLLKIYGMNDSLFHILVPWIKFQKKERKNLEFESIVCDSITYSDSLEINSCTFSDLRPLLNYNTSLASRILNYKSLVGGFYCKAQLREVYGLSDSLFNKIDSLLYVDSTKIKKLSLTKSEYMDLIRHPYLQKEQVELLLSYRNFAGDRANLSEFLSLKIWDDSLIMKIKPYLAK